MENYRAASVGVAWTASGADDIPGGNTIPADAWQDNFSNFGSQKQVEAEARDG